MMALSARGEVTSDAAEVGRIAQGYLTGANGDPHRALAAAIYDALIDLEEADRRALEQGRLISAGYARRRAAAAG